MYQKSQNEVQIYFRTVQYAMHLKKKLILGLGMRAHFMLNSEHPIAHTHIVYFYRESNVKAVTLAGHL